MRARCRVVLTRSAEDNARLRAALIGVPAELVDYPCIAVEGVPLPANVAEKLRCGAYSAVVFVSRNAVDHFFTTVHLAAPSEVIAIGPSTSEAVLRHGWPVSAVPSGSNVASALKELDQLVRSAGPVLYVRGDLGEDLLPAALRERGKVVEIVVVYRATELATDPLATDDRPTLLTFASPSALRQFMERNPQQRAPVLAIGETTAQAARDAGFEVSVAPSPSIQGMAAAIQRWATTQA